MELNLKKLARIVPPAQDGMENPIEKVDIETVLLQFAKEGMVGSFLALAEDTDYDLTEDRFALIKEALIGCRCHDDLLSLVQFCDGSLDIYDMLGTVIVAESWAQVLVDDGVLWGPSCYLVDHGREVFWQYAGHAAKDRRKMIEAAINLSDLALLQMVVDRAPPADLMPTLIKTAWENALIQANVAVLSLLSESPFYNAYALALSLRMLGDEEKMVPWYGIAQAMYSMEDVEPVLVACFTKLMENLSPSATSRIMRIAMRGPVGVSARWTRALFLNLTAPPYNIDMVRDALQCGHTWLAAFIIRSGRIDNGPLLRFHLNPVRVIHDNMHAATHGALAGLIPWYSKLTYLPLCHLFTSRHQYGLEWRLLAEGNFAGIRRLVSGLDTDVEQGEYLEGLLTRLVLYRAGLSCVDQPNADYMDDRPWIAAVCFVLSMNTKTSCVLEGNLELARALYKIDLADLNLSESVLQMLIHLRALMGDPITPG